MTQATATHDTRPQRLTPEHSTGCSDVRDLTRLRYFHGRALSALDLRREQAFHLEKDRLHNRLLHGWGIVCGLEVEILPKEECDPCDEGPPTLVVKVHPGAAIDCGGNDIVVRRARAITIETLLGEADVERLRRAPATVYLTLCFHEELIDPSRPLLTAGCEPVPACEYGRVRETYRICASTTSPDRGPACEPCCGGCGCGDACLELAAITCFEPGGDLDPDQLDLGGRRALARHDLAEICEINWVHGATYSREGATALFAEGIEVRFSRPVQVASLRPGVVDLTVVEAGGGRASGMYDMRGVFTDLPAQKLTDRFNFQSTTDETLQYGDRVLIRIRCDFIVDECCQAVDGNHIGGGVPTLPECPAEPVEPPDRPPCPPRCSGDGTEGGLFESWIFVQTKQPNGKGGTTDGDYESKGESDER